MNIISSKNQKNEFQSWLLLAILIVQVFLLIFLNNRIGRLEQVFLSRNNKTRTVDSVPDERGHTIGKADATITIVEFADYQCPFCFQAVEPMKTLINKYPNQIRFVYRHFPLDNHPDAYKAAEAAECAGEQQKFWEMHEMLFRYQDALSQEDLLRYAQNINLNLEQFKNCMESDRSKDLIEKDKNDGLFYGVNGTPTFFVNRQVVVGLSGLENKVVEAITEQNNN